MRLTFDKQQECNSSSHKLFNAYLSFHGVHVRPEDLEISYNKVYDFWDIHVYKCNRNIVGNGTKEYREQNWLNVKEGLKDLFPDSEMQLDTWRWAYYPVYKGVELDDTRIEGVRFWIRCE